MIHVLTHYTPSFKEIADITIPVMQKYCDKHGYKLSVKECDYSAYNGLDKLNHITEVCEEGDIALVLDADCLITNFNEKVTYFLKSDKYLFLCEGFNMGAFIIRKSWHSTWFISKMIELISNGTFDCEQDAIEKEINDEHGYKPIEIYPHPAFNSYLSQYYPEVKQPVTKEQGQWEQGCFILHVPALDLNKRAEILREHTKYIVYE